MTIKEWVISAKNIDSFDILNSAGDILESRVSVFTLVRYLDCPIKEIQYVNDTAFNWVTAHITITEDSEIRSEGQK